MTIVTTIFPDDEADSRGVGDLGRFKFKKLTKRLKKIAKPLTSIAKPLLSMGQGGGLLTAMGPWGWAAGAAAAAGGALAAKHRKKKLKKKRRAQQQAIAQEAAYQSAPSEPGIMPDAVPPMSLPEQYPPPDVVMPSWEQPGEPVYAAPSEAAMEPSPAEAPPADVMVLPSDHIPEVQAVLDPEPVIMAGLGAPGATAPGIDWRILSVFTGFTLGTWLLLKDRPSPRSRRRGNYG